MGSIEDNVAVPPLVEDGVVGGRGVGVTGEDDRDGCSTAKADGGEDIGEDGLGHGGEIVLHVDH